MFRSFGQSSVINASRDAVWERIASFDGINAELMPYMRMTVPREHAATTIDTVPVGQSLGRAWIFYGGFLPLDYDALTLTELVPGSHFQEISTMASMRRWEHRRELEAVGEQATRVTDTIGFEPRISALAPLVEPLLRRIFAHRHRRLAAYFAELTSPSP